MCALFPAAEFMNIPILMIIICVMTCIYEWKDYEMKKLKNRFNKLTQTNSEISERTDRRTDNAISISPSNFVGGDHKNERCKTKAVRIFPIRFCLAVKLRTHGQFTKSETGFQHLEIYCFLPYFPRIPRVPMLVINFP